MELMNRRIVHAKKKSPELKQEYSLKHSKSQISVKNTYMTTVTSPHFFERAAGQ